MASGGSFGNATIDAYDNNIVSVWKLEEASGTRDDPVGSNDLSDINTVGSTTGKSGTCATFVAANNERLSIADASQVGLDFERTSTFSISAWVKTSTAAYMQIATKINSSGNTGYQLFFNNDGTISAVLTNTFASNRIQTTTTVSGYDDGAWHNVVLTYDGSSDVSGLIIYVDGSEPASVDNANTLSASIDNSDGFALGAYDSGAQDWNGEIDEVTVWNAELSSGAVSAINNSGTGRFWTADASSSSSSSPGESSSSSLSSSSSSSSTPSS